MKLYHFWLLAITLIALVLRFYNLTYHSLWFDEAVSVHWARQSVPRILEVGLTLAEDRLPPLYYLLLKGWTGLVGFSETGVRSLSVLLGTLLVPVSARIASMLFNRRIALMTALLVAVNPFLIWYSQEARMYAPAVLFSLLTVWAFLLMTRTVTREGNQHHSLRLARYTAGFTLMAVAGLYTHLYTGFVLPALGLWLGVSYFRRWRLWLAFALSGLIISLAFAPLALATWRFSGEAMPSDPLTGLGQRAWTLLQAFILWKAPLPPVLQFALPMVVTLFILAAYLPLSRLRFSADVSRFPYPRLLVSLLLVFPFAIATLLLLRNHLAFFGERYFIVMVPWLLLLAAIGAAQVGVGSPGRQYRFGAYTAYFILLGCTLIPLPGQWTIPAAKEAWRQSVAYLAGHAGPDHGILIHPDWVRYPFQFYFQGPGQTYAAFSNITPTMSLDGPLQGVVGQHPVIWLIQSHLEGPDPDRRVEQWFAARYPLVTELYPPGISLKGYATGYQLDSLPPEATASDIEFANGLRLVGYQVDTTVTATDELFHPPSGWLHVILYWAATKPIGEDVAPLVSLVGPEGVWGSSLERQNDALTLYPTSRWAVEPADSTLIRHDVDVNLNPATPPGQYQLLVSLSGNPAEQYLLAEIEVRR